MSSWEIWSTNLQAAVYNALLLAGMLMLEGATGGWFINQPIFGTGLLDHGSWFTFWWFTPLSLLATMAVGHRWPPPGSGGGRSACFSTRQQPWPFS